MGKLTQVALVSILQTMIQDENFLESLLECIKRIFEIAPPNLGTDDPFEAVVDRIINHFEIQKIEIPGIRSTLIGMLKEKQFLAFARNLRMLKDLLGYTDARIINYLKQLKFRTEMDGESISPWIDVQSTAEAVYKELDPHRMRIFTELSDEEKCLLQGFTPERIAVMSKFSRKGIVLLSKLGRLPPHQRSMIFGMDQDESRLLRDLGFSEIRFLMRINNYRSEGGQNTLQKFIEREAEVIEDMTDDAGRLAEGIHDLNVEEREKYLNLSPKEVDILNNMNDDDRKVVSRFKNLDEVLNVAKNLHSSQRNLISSLRREEILAFLGNIYGAAFPEIQRIVRYSPLIIQRSHPLSIIERDAVLTLNKQQRSVLARAYAVGRDGLLMIRKLGPKLTDQVFNGKKGLTVMQTALKKKLANVNFDKNILPRLFEIMEHEFLAILFDLSWKGIEFLRKTSDLNEEMIGIVRRLSDNGMEVLLNNDRLTGAEISMLGNLNTNEGNLLINLDVEQRDYLSNQPDLTKLTSDLFDRKQRTKLGTLSDGAKSVLERIILLSDEEHRLLQGLRELDTSVLSDLPPAQLNLLASLTSEVFDLLSSFMCWKIGEELIFKILRIPIGTSYENKIGQIRQILGRILRNGWAVDHPNHIPLVAGAIEVLRLTGVVTDNFVEEMIPMIEEPTLSLIFKVNLIKFSLRDSTALVPRPTFHIGGIVEDIVTISRFNRIRTVEDLMFVRWILSSSSTMNEKGLFEVGRGSLIHLSHHLDDGHKLEALLSESTSQLDGIEHEVLMKNFKHMLSANQHLLSSFFFFAVGRRTTTDEATSRLSKLFEENFTADECFRFLNSLAYDGFLRRRRDDGLAGILSDDRFLHPTIFEVSLYYNRGNVLALTERLDEGQLWKLVERRPVMVLQIMTRNVQVDLIKLFGKVGKVEEIWEGNRRQIIRTVFEELTRLTPDFNPRMYLHIARGIRRLMYWPSFLGTDTYVVLISKYTKLVQRRVSTEELNQVLDSFVSPDVSREYLIEVIDGLDVGVRDRDRRSCNVMRKKRGATVQCMDSENTRDLTTEAEQRIQQSTFDDTQSVLYNRLLEHSELRFRSEEIDPEIRQDLMSRMKDISVDSLDPRIKGIVATLDDPEKFDTILKQSGTLNKIEKVASATGLAFTLLLVGKHMINGDIQNLGYDALNLWLMPKIGGHITEVLEKSYPVIGPVLGSAVTNFAAYLGLVEGIMMRRKAVDEIDEDLAELSIVTNTVFIVANMPVVATRIMASFGAEATIIGEFAGPVGSALSVSVIVGSYLIGAGLEMERVTEHIQLSLGEKLTLYWDLLRDHPVPEQLKIDVAAKELYTEYIVSHLRRLNGTYDKIALSLPSFSITNTSIKMDFTPRVDAKYPFSTSHKLSRLFPENLVGYDFVCGPSARDAEERNVSSQTRELFIPSGPNDDCRNIVSFRKHGSLNSSRTFLYVAADASIDLLDDNSLVMVFHGRNLILEDHSSNGSMNTFHIQNELASCNVYKKGQNFFYVVEGSFECDLREEIDGQLNTVVITSNFKDSRGIHSIIGSEKQERIESLFANFVDGRGGGDLIRAREKTIVKGYFNDFITGNCAVILPFIVNEIAKINAQMRIAISDREGSWLGVDGNARIITADYYILTPMRTSNDTTQRVIRAHIWKNLKQTISIEDELPVLRNLTIPNCKLVKQITSANCDIVLSDVGLNVFQMDKNNHEYYWEAPKQPGNLYIFKKMFGRVTISHANGILDFKELGVNLSHNHSSSRGVYELTIGGLHVSLLPNYGNVKYTYDGRKYFKLGKSGISRDWCSHTLKISGRVLIDGNDLHNSYNCFEIQSHKIFFLRMRDDLVLVSGKQVLTICRYYFHGNKNLELSVKLKDGRIIEAPRFRKRAGRAHEFIYYEVGSSELVIYHNQPVDQHHIGYVDLKHQSIKDVDMIVTSGRLILLYRNSTLVRIENWDNYEPARYMVFAFNDSFLPNAECILSDCESNDIIQELEIEKRRRSATSSASRGSSWINVIINPIRNYYATLFLPGTPNKFNPNFLITSNINLVFLLLQNLLDRISPPVKLPTITTVETLSNVIEFIEKYQGTNASFQLYSEIVELVRNQRYDAIQHIIQQKSKQSHDEFNCHN